jgi:hypothetical protein
VAQPIKTAMTAADGHQRHRRREFPIPACIIERIVILQVLPTSPTALACTRRRQSSLFRAQSSSVCCGNEAQNLQNKRLDSSY